MSLKPKHASTKTRWTAQTRGEARRAESVRKSQEALAAREDFALSRELAHEEKQEQGL